jgi:hypothetical protein
VTMTTPITLPAHDLRTAILTGLHPIRATVRLHPAALDRQTAQRATQRQLEGAQDTARAALTKNLDPAGLTIADGTLDWSLDRNGRGEWTLSVVWRPR